MRFNEPLSISDAETTFKYLVDIAKNRGYRSVQIRQGRDEVVEEWRVAV